MCDLQSNGEASMVMCLRCNNETRTTAIVTAGGQELMVAGTVGRDPEPLSAQVCTACGFVQLFAPQQLNDSVAAAEETREPSLLGELLGERPTVA
jgi:hypothetical protein